MKTSTLKPFLRKNLDILFVGLNPAKGSSDNGHYFSVKQAFWNQLYKSGLITENVDKMNADDKIFKQNNLNLNHFSYGITDLLIHIAESDSSKIKPSKEDCIRLKNEIEKYKPKVIVLLHGKVLKTFLPFLNYKIPKSNSGQLGCLINQSMFFNIAFPHGNSITDDDKIKEYIKLKKYLLSLQH